MDSEQQTQRWCREAAKGDLEAASSLLHKHYAQIYRYLRRLVGHDEDAADVTQEAFRRVWRSIQNFRGQSKVSTWMHRVAYCAYIDWSRKQRPATRQSEHWWRELPCGAPLPTEQAMHSERLHRLWRWVDQLDPEQKQVVHLHYGQQLSLSETAQVLEVPLSTLKLRLRHAVDRLRSRMLASEQPARALQSATTIKPAS